MTVCQDCLGLDVHMDAMPEDWAFRKPTPTLAETMRKFGPCPSCRTEIPGPSDDGPSQRAGGDTRMTPIAPPVRVQLPLFMNSG